MCLGETRLHSSRVGEKGGATRPNDQREPRITCMGLEISYVSVRTLAAVQHYCLRKFRIEKERSRSELRSRRTMTELCLWRS